MSFLAQSGNVWRRGFSADCKEWTTHVNKLGCLHQCHLGERTWLYMEQRLMSGQYIGSGVDMTSVMNQMLHLVTVEY